MSKEIQEYKNLEELLDRIKTVNLIERIFSWSSIKKLSYDAYDEFKSIDKITELAVKDAISRLEMDKAKLNEQITQLHNKDKENIKAIAEHNSIKQKEQQDYQKNITEINTLRNQMDQDRQKIQRDREEEIANNLKKMKETWKTHETDVEDYLKKICKKQGINYFDKEKVPIKGKPDNTIEIADQYIIFDAKSPASDDLRNFPQYIKTQAETLKKYIKEENVKKDIYLVVPDNTIDCIKEHTYNLADYDVYVITKSSLEPIILSLRKIEDYEFADKLSPEDRDAISRIIGKFAHTTKRRMQVDSFFFDEYLNILTNCNSLPDEIKEQAVKCEMSDKLNPPLEKRVKQISEKELREDFVNKKQVAKAKKIQTDVNLLIEEK